MFVLYKSFWLVCMFDMPFRGLKNERKRTAFSTFFLENAMNSLSARAALSEFIKNSLNICVSRRTR